MLIPAGVDGFTQLMKLRESNNNLRFVTGFIGGIGLKYTVVGASLATLTLGKITPPHLCTHHNQRLFQIILDIYSRNNNNNK